jgi:CheY-like chemotaxis protein
MPRTISIVYAEDDLETRTRMLQDWKETEAADNCDYLKCVAATTNVEDAWEAILKYEPDVAVLDINLAGGKNGLELARRLYDQKQKNSKLHTKVLLLSVYDGLLAEALDNFKSKKPYCHGLVDKMFPSQTIRQAISDVHGDICAIRTPCFTFQVPNKGHERDFLLRAACPNSVIIDEFKRDAAYIKSVFESILKKLRVLTRAAAVVVGLKIKLISLEEAFCIPRETGTSMKEILRQREDLKEVWKNLALSDSQLEIKLKSDPARRIKEIFDWLYESNKGDIEKESKRAGAVLYALKHEIFGVDAFEILDRQGESWISKKPMV